MSDVRAVAIEFLRLPMTSRVRIARELGVLSEDEEVWWPRIFERIRVGGLIERLAEATSTPFVAPEIIEEGEDA